MSIETTQVKTRKAKPRQQSKDKVYHMPPYHVILLNDDDHTYEYVIRMLGELFGHPVPKAFQMAQEVDSRGRAIVDTTTKERAELKQEQIHAYGADPLSKNSKGSMSAVIEPAE
ncbi:MAG: ATP-dependent Clp protease adaptor ClpS [Planctomycetia bacterium]|nr:ATP-dependent Clp protease adaptor ClpS [Planctomycetia bacterium]